MTILETELDKTLVCCDGETVAISNGWAVIKLPIAEAIKYAKQGIGKGGKDGFNDTTVDVRIQHGSNWLVVSYKEAQVIIETILAESS